MAQTYPDIPSTKTVRDSRQDILDRDEAIRSAFSGTTFPSTNLVVGMLCFRTDLGQLYQLTVASPVTWTRVPLGVPVPIAQGGTNATDAATARSNLGLAALAVKNTVAAADIDNAAVQNAKIQDSAITTAKIGDAQVTTAKIADAQVTTGKISDGAITSAKLADGTIATTDLATQTITDIRAGVDLGSRVAKSGDTMTGTLTAPGLVSSGSVRSGATGDNARATGFAIADGTDIGELNRSTQYKDDRMSNCRGYMPNGNCAGNTAYNPPNGNWWSWGVAGVPTGNCTNNSQFDGAGGNTNTLFPVTTNFIYDGYYELANEIGGSEQHRNYNNCNCSNCTGYSPAGFNCRTNCNCNCACACDCTNCNCDCSCVPAGTLVRMGDGALRKIENIEVGAKLWGGGIVLSTRAPLLGARLLWNINNQLKITGDHLVRVKDSWACIEPELMPRRIVQGIAPEVDYRQLSQGDEILTERGWETVQSIDALQAPPDTKLFTLSVNGPAAFYAEGICIDGINTPSAAYLAQLEAFA